MTIDHPPARLIASVLGLSSFAVALAAGWIASNPGTTTIMRAIIAMVCGYALGRVLGWAAEVTAREYLETYTEAHPIPDPLPAVESTGSETD
ncbi:MAG: hypothetical protein AAGI53_12745 [Planctomycetota bacterium]